MQPIVTRITITMTSFQLSCTPADEWVPYIVYHYHDHSILQTFAFKTLVYTLKSSMDLPTAGRFHIATKSVITSELSGSKHCYSNYTHAMSIEH